MDHLLIKKPWITEKATALTASNQYVFMVKSTATKPEVKKSGRGIRGKTDGYRKAIVTIKEGQKIDLN